MPFALLPDLVTESGSQLAAPVVAYETQGRFTGDNAVLIEHALTGDQQVGTWWGDLVGPGRALDTDRWYVVCPNVLGGCNGSTGPSTIGPHHGSRFPALSIRDQVAFERALADKLGINSWSLIMGGSMGGMRALEWAVTDPERVQRLALLATSAAASAEQIALCSLQLHAITDDPLWRGGDYDPQQPPAMGLGLARRIAHVSYRSESELQQRFGRNSQPDDPQHRFAVESYLDHQARKLTDRFDAGSYVSLTRAMNAHDVGRGRGSIATALDRVSANTLVVSIDSDRLYLPIQQREIASGIPAADWVQLKSPYGHDGFLLETEQIGAALKALF
jgi:homoserine O-acetyltransferase